MKLLLVMEASFCFLFSCGFIFSSIHHKETKAGLRFAPLGIGISIIYLALSLKTSNENHYDLLTLIFALLPFITTALFFLPTTKKRKYPTFVPPENIDERDTMFSRIKLKEGTTNFAKYYAKNPSSKNIDREIRKLPGLLSTNAKYANTYAMASAKGTFKIVDHLHSLIQKEPSIPIKEIDIKQTKTFLSEWMRKLGAHSVGFTKLEKNHFYSVGGRGDRYNQPNTNNHKYAICFTVEMSAEMVQASPQASIVMESSEQYLNSGIISLQVAEFIKQLGYEARVHMDGNYEVLCNMVAKSAGLGEIGRMGLLLTPKLGPRVRIGVISTNLPIPVDKPTHDESVLHFCSICKKCATTCPSQAVTKKDRGTGKGWAIDREKCFSYWCKAGTDCGRCMATCPYAHRNDPFHNLVRWGIQRSVVFRHIANQLDNYLYGQKPKPKNLPKWIPVKVQH